MVGVGLGGVADGLGKMPVGSVVISALRGILAEACMSVLDNGTRRAVAIMTNAAKVTSSFDLRRLFIGNPPAPQNP